MNEWYSRGTIRQWFSVCTIGFLHMERYILSSYSFLHHAHVSVIGVRCLKCLILLFINFLSRFNIGCTQPSQSFLPIAFMKVPFKMELLWTKGSHLALISLGQCRIGLCSFMFRYVELHYVMWIYNVDTSKPFLNHILGGWIDNIGTNYRWKNIFGPECS